MDRAVTIFRNQIRRGIRTVKAGDEPRGLSHEAAAVILTYCNDTSIGRVRPAEVSAADRQMMRETGRRLTETYLKDPPLMTHR
jgi:hypothetical protein